MCSTGWVYVRKTAIAYTKQSFGALNGIEGTKDKMMFLYAYKSEVIALCFRGTECLVVSIGIQQGLKKSLFKLDFDDGMRIVEMVNSSKTYCTIGYEETASEESLLRNLLSSCSLKTTPS